MWNTSFSTRERIGSSAGRCREDEEGAEKEEEEEEDDEEDDDEEDDDEEEEEVEGRLEQDGQVTPAPCPSPAGVPQNG
jgi:hypothetical protein